MKLTGKVGAKEKEFVYEANFPDKNLENSSIARVWATSKVGYLLDEMRLRGESSEVRKEVIRLAKKFGILTPYTSYLVVEDERRRVAQRPRRWGGRHADGADMPPEEAPSSEPSTAGVIRGLKKAEEKLAGLAKEQKEEAGKAAVDASKARSKLKDAVNAPNTALIRFTR